MSYKTSTSIALQSFPTQFPALPFLVPIPFLAPTPFPYLPIPLLLATLVWAEIYNNRYIGPYGKHVCPTRSMTKILAICK